MTDDMPTSQATTEQTEPEVVAGITSAEGQPETYKFDATPPVDLRLWSMLGGAALFGFFVGLDMMARRRR
ncbi:MAG TPA: hypothetical protein VME45_08040 [Stellaceae bacterium]|nr:hypothetical protein [Stellaceae bacterium]